MNCPRCRGVVPAGAGFCPNCGNDLRAFLAQAAQMAAQQAAQQAPQGNSRIPAPENRGGPAPGYFQPASGMTAPGMPLPKKKSNLGWIVAGVFAVALLLLGFFAMRLLQKTGTDTPTAILTKTGREQPILQKTGNEAPVLQKTDSAPVKTVMPDDIRRWLEHLEAIEKKRAALAQKGLASLMMLAPQAQVGMDLDGIKALAGGDPEADMPKSSADKVADSSADSKKEWTDLRQRFDSFPPPAECQTIADSYGHALDETGAMIGDILDAVAKSQEDTQGALQALYGMQNQSKSIDEYGQATDGKVRQICDKYDTKKWFSIAGDFGNSSVFSSFGMR